MKRLHSSQVEEDMSRKDPQNASRKASHCGHRGRKHRKQAQREARQSEVNARARRLELDRRVPLVAKIRPWMTELCRRSSCGVATDTIDDRSMSCQFFCPEGRVLSCVIGVEDVVIEKVMPWTEMSSSYLKSVMKRPWKSFRSKNILEIISDKISLLEGPGV